MYKYKAHEEIVKSRKQNIRSGIMWKLIIANYGGDKSYDKEITNNIPSVIPQMKSGRVKCTRTLRKTLLQQKISSSKSTRLISKLKFFTYYERCS